MFYDTRNEKCLLTLHPSLHPRARTLLLECERLGVWLLLTEGKRTFIRQVWLYASGRFRPGQILTYAKPGTSKHESGRALDFVPADDKGGLHYEDWNRIEQIGKLAKSQGWTWGNDFPRFPDKVHIEWNGQI